MSKPWAAHLLRANTRFGNRLANQFAGAITYFSVLALVPILMFAFSMLGMTMTVFRPDLLGQVTQKITEQVSGTGGQQIAGLVKEYLSNWRGVGIISLVSLFYAGSGWVGNLRVAVQSQWRPEFEYDAAKKNIVLQTLSNMGVLILILLGVGLSFTMTLSGTTMSDVVAGWLHLGQWPLGHWILRLTTLLLTVLSSWLLFAMLFVILPADHRPTKEKAWGGLMAAVLFTVLQTFAGVLVGLFSHNKAVSLFGPVIVLMLVLNLFARLVLFIACWIATAHQPAIAFHYNECDEPVRDDPLAETAEDHWDRADEDHKEQLAEADQKEYDKTLKEGGLPPVEPVHYVSRPTTRPNYRPTLDLEEFANPDPDRVVSEPVAHKAVKAGMKAGWVLGAGAGIGLGSVATRALVWRRNRRERRAATRDR